MIARWPNGLSLSASPDDVFEVVSGAVAASIATAADTHGAERIARVGIYTDDAPSLSIGIRQGEGAPNETVQPDVLGPYKELADRLTDEAAGGGGRPRPQADDLDEDLDGDLDEDDLEEDLDEIDDAPVATTADLGGDDDPVEADSLATALEGVVAAALLEALEALDDEILRIGVEVRYNQRALNVADDEDPLFLVDEAILAGLAEDAGALLEEQAHDVSTDEWVTWVRERLEELADDADEDLEERFEEVFDEDVDERLQRIAEAWEDAPVDGELVLSWITRGCAVGTED